MKKVYLMYKVKKLIANHMFKRFTFSKAIYILKGNSVYQSHSHNTLYTEKQVAPES